MAFHTFKHPDFASKYRNYRIITRDDPKSPKADYAPADTLESEDSLRLMFRMSDKEWVEAQTLLANKGYFVFFLGTLMSDLPE